LYEIGNLLSNHPKGRIPRVLLILAQILRRIGQRHVETKSEDGNHLSITNCNRACCAKSAPRGLQGETVEKGHSEGGFVLLKGETQIFDGSCGESGSEQPPTHLVLPDSLVEFVQSPFCKIRWADMGE